MEFSLQTYRLADIMKQISANQMDEIVKKEKMHNERVANDLKMGRYALVKNRVASNMRNIENEPCNEEEKIKKQKKLGTVWNAAKSFRNNTDKDADSMNKAKSLDKTEVVPTKFMKAAKIAVMISHVKAGSGERWTKDCTCYSLDAKCYLHDS